MPGPDRERIDANAGVWPGADVTSPDGFVCLRDELDDAAIRFTLSGELNIATAPELDQALSDAQRSAKLVIVDLRRVSFMDCRGLAVITAAASRTKGDPMRYRVERGPPQVHRLFTLTVDDRGVEISETA
jgi:anti-anti-sigma factor